MPPTLATPPSRRRLGSGAAARRERAGPAAPRREPRARRRESRTSRGRPRGRRAAGRRCRRSPSPSARHLGRLHGRRVDRPAAVEVERDPAASRAARPPQPPVDGNPPELDPVREHEHVRRESVPTEVRRLPEPLRRDVRLPARRRAAGRGGRSTRRGGRGRRRGRPGRDTGSPARDRLRGARSSEPSSWRTAVPPLSATSPGSASRRCGGRAGGSGSPSRETRPGRRARAARARCRRPRPFPTPLAPRRGASSSPCVAVPASGSPAASDEPEHVRARAHAGSLSASSRASAGSIPSSAANARYSASAFAVSRPGRATARSRTFFGVCSSSTNSSTCTS